MEVSSMDKKVDRLAEMLKSTDTKIEYNIVEDLEQLQRLYGVIKPKEYRKKLLVLVEKYKTSEITEIRSALLKKCLAGDINAIRLYCDYFKQSEAVAADDGLVEALMARGKDVFKDEN